MKRKRRLFTDYEMELLRQNPYTYKVRQRQLSFTAEVKHIFWNRYQHGEAVAGYIREAGANVVGEPLYIKGGLPFAFLKSFKEDEQKVVTDWINGVVAEVTK